MNDQARHFGDADLFSQDIKTVPIKGGFQVSIGYFTPGCAAATIPIRNSLNGLLAVTFLVTVFYISVEPIPNFVPPEHQIVIWLGANSTLYLIAAKVAEIGELIYNMGYFYCGRGNKKLKIDVTRSRIRIKRGWWRWDEIERRSHIAFMAVNYDLERRQPNDKENVYRNTKEIWLEQGELHYHLADMANHEEARQLVLRLQLVNEMVTT